MNTKTDRSIVQFCYIAQPYLHESGAVMDARAKSGNLAAAYLVSKGVHCHSPIGASHAVNILARDRFGAEQTHDYWLTQDISMIMQCCNMMAILKLPGWEKSKGLREEMDLCERAHIPFAWVEWPGLYDTMHKETLADLDKIARMWWGSL